MFVATRLRMIRSGGGLQFNCILVKALSSVQMRLISLPSWILLGVRLLVGHRGRLGDFVLPASNLGPVSGVVTT